MSITPPCPVFGKCGGCQFQDQEYSFQLAVKKQRVLEYFAKTGIPIPADLKVYFKEEYYYRNRMDFVIGPEGPGLREPGKFYKIVNFEKCVIANKKINETLGYVREWFFANRAKLDVFDTRARSGTLRYAVMRAPYYSGDTIVTFILKSESEKKEEHLAIIREFADKYPVNNVLAGYVRFNTDVSATTDYDIIKGSDMIWERLASFKLFYHSQAFFQNNSPVTLDILFHIKEKVAGSYDVLCDLFGGMGTFGIFLADKAKEVIVADNSALDIACVAKNIAENGIKNVTGIQLDAIEFSKLTGSIAGKKKLFVVDPPRSGMHKKAMKFIRESKPETIVYVSCNPENFGRDIENLKDLYSVEDIAIFDMFPQTKHVEATAILNLKF